MQLLGFEKSGKFDSAQVYILYAACFAFHASA